MLEMFSKKVRGIVDMPSSGTKTAPIAVGLLAFSLFVCMSTTAHAQYIVPGSNLTNGYDPTQNAFSVMTGQSNIMDASRQNIQGSSSALQSQTQNYMNQQNNTQTGSSSSQTKINTDAATSSGFGMLPQNDIQSIVPSTTKSETKKQTDTQSSSQEETDPNQVNYQSVNIDPTVGMSDAEKKRHRELMQILNKGSVAPSQDAISQTKQVADKQTSVNHTHVSGRAWAVDGITLHIGSEDIILYGLRGPGNGQVCYHSGTPWPCGEYAQASLGKIVSDTVVSCDVVDGKGACVNDTGDDIAVQVALTGYAIGVDERLSRYSHIAHDASRGVFSND